MRLLENTKEREQKRERGKRQETGHMIGGHDKSREHNPKKQRVELKRKRGNFKNRAMIGRHNSIGGIW